MHGLLGMPRTSDWRDVCERCRHRYAHLQNTYGRLTETPNKLDAHVLIHLHASMSWLLSFFSPFC